MLLTMKGLFIIPILCGFFSLTAVSQTIEKVVFSSVAASNNEFQPISGTPYGESLAGSGGSLDVSSYYGGNTVDVVTQTQSLSNDFEISVYPNPTVDELIITQTSSSFKPFQMELYDLKGRLLEQKSSQSQNELINVSHHSAGEYILKISGIKDEQMVFKIIKR